MSRRGRGGRPRLRVRIPRGPVGRGRLGGRSTMPDERANRDERPSVTIVGAGIAGMTAALRLLEAGFDVTIFEKAGTVGGKFGALKVGATYHEHAYHFLSDWCLNFWAVARSIGLSKDQDFVRRDAI